MIIAVSDCKRKQTVQNSRYQTKGGGAGGGAIAPQGNILDEGADRILPISLKMGIKID